MSAAPRLRLITWNVARRVETLPAQAAAIARREPDIVALQDVTARTLRAWQVAFATLDLPHVECTLRGADREDVRRERRSVEGSARGARRPAARPAQGG
jgi:endonuclease/exonuclease/phosphatase family metal-dependent hydrolase